jgi:hypothetical protein
MGHTMEWIAAPHEYPRQEVKSSFQYEAQRTNMIFREKKRVEDERTVRSKPRQSFSVSGIQKERWSL